MLQLRINYSASMQIFNFRGTDLNMVCYKYTLSGVSAASLTDVHLDSCMLKQHYSIYHHSVHTSNE